MSLECLTRFEVSLSLSRGGCVLGVRNKKRRGHLKGVSPILSFYNNPFTIMACQALKRDYTAVLQSLRLNKC